MKLFLSAHGTFASGLLASVSIIFGDTKNLTIFDAYIDEKSVEDELVNFIDLCDKEEKILLLSDLYGGSVNQIMSRYVDNERIFLITGINLPLLLEALMLDDSISYDSLTALVNKAQDSIQLISLENLELSNEDDFF